MAYSRGRPPGRVYPTVVTDAVVLKVCDEQVTFAKLSQALPGGAELANKMYDIAGPRPSQVRSWRRCSPPSAAPR